MVESSTSFFSSACFSLPGGAGQAWAAASSASPKKHPRMVWPDRFLILDQACGVTVLTGAELAYQTVRRTGSDQEAGSGNPRPSKTAKTGAASGGCGAAREPDQAASKSPTSREKREKWGTLNFSFLPATP